MFSAIFIYTYTHHVYYVWLTVLEFLILGYHKKKVIYKHLHLIIENQYL